jgi:Hyaluronidase
MRRLFLFTVVSLGWISVPGQAVSSQHPFPVFDATDFAQKPDLSPYGLKRLPVVYPAYMFDSKEQAVQTNLPDQKRVNAFAKLAAQSSNILVIDIEQWPLEGDPATVAASVAKLQTVLRWFKSSAPSTKIGFYGFPPLRDYWDSVQQEGTPRYKSWQAKNDAIAPIAQLADVLFPSLYTFYADRDGWAKYAIAEIREARRYAGGKPVYVFLWPQYETGTLANTFLPGDFWLLQLETANKYADGVVIWCCTGRQTWDDKAPWWLETQKFMKQIHSTQP